MRNRLSIADEGMAIFGGRNIADEYFARNPTASLRRPRRARDRRGRYASRAIFDAYWTSPQT
jgi:putative cardiolipin synthase